MSEPALLGFVVDLVETEPRRKPLRPFEVIQKTPVVVAANVDPRLDRPGDPGKVGGDVGAAEGVLCVGRAVFGDVDRKPKTVPHALCNPKEAFRVDLPAEVRLRRARVRHPISEKAPRPQPEVDVVAAVVVYPEKV